ncbi:MAG: hypothetical protein Fur0018_19020 [Anaerolineales bacterium]
MPSLPRPILILLAAGLLLGGYALISSAQASADTPLAAWIETRDGENRLLAAPADALDSPRPLTSLPPGEIVHTALAPDGRTLALVTTQGDGETLWLVSLPDGGARQISQATGFDIPVWAADGRGLSYTAYLPGETHLAGKDATRRAAAPLPQARWYSPQNLLPIPQPHLAGHAQTLVWLDANDKPYPIGRAQRGLSALWDAGAQRVLLTRPEGAHVRLQSLNPLTGATQHLADLPPGDWHLLARRGAWAAAEWYPHGVQIIALGRGNFRALGETRRFIGLLPPIGSGSPLQGGTFPPRAAGSPTVTVIVTPPVTVTSSPTPSPSLTPLPSPTITPSPTASPSPTQPPTCAPPPNGCPVPRYAGYQPARTTLGTLFGLAVQNGLGNAAPAPLGIYSGRPPVQVTPSAQRPLPAMILRGIALQESTWLQFSNGQPPWEDTTACTLISFDCGYGLMQVTSCMSGGCAWLNPTRTAAELPYNLGAGMNILIQKWNSVPYLGDNDFSDPAQWYYAVLAYNGWSTLNDPNNTTRFDPRRPPFRETGLPYAYPYQERVYGWLAHPYHVAGQELWRPTRYPEVPRGIFGLRRPDSWTPPAETSRPLMHLFHDLTFSPARPLTLTIQNTTPYTLSADVMFYTADGAFDRRYLPPSADPPWFVAPYLRIAPSSTLSLPLSTVFFTETFTGTLRAYASEGLSLTLDAPLPGKPLVYLPLVFKENAQQMDSPPQAACQPLGSNGGFEIFRDGRPLGWDSFSQGGYALADSTWFWQGHFGGYLGGYNAARDILTQTWNVPTTTLTVTLQLAWDVTSAQAADAPPTDVLTVTLLDSAGQPLGAPWTLSNADAPGGWAYSTVTWPPQGAPPAGVRFEVRTDSDAPTAFFVDEVEIRGCRAP